MRTPRTSEQPDGAAVVINAVHELDDAEAEIKRLESVLGAAKVKLGVAWARLQKLLGQDGCDSHGPAIEPHTSALDTLPIYLRIGYRLLDNPLLSYQETAVAIWGPGLSKYVAKNRINMHMTRLKKVGIARPLGSNRYKIDGKKLSELSGIPLADP